MPVTAAVYAFEVAGDQIKRIWAILKRICALNRGRRMAWLRICTAVALGRRGEPIDRDVGPGLGGELGPGPVGVPRL